MLARLPLSEQRAAVSSVHQAVLSKHRAQHPRGFFVRLQALRQQIGRGLIVRAIGSGKDFARRACHGFLALHELANHLFGRGHAIGLGDRRELREILVAARRVDAQRTNALGDRVDSQREFVVLTFEHQVQRIEHRARDIPMKVVSQ